MFIMQVIRSLSSDYIRMRVSNTIEEYIYIYIGYLETCMCLRGAFWFALQ